MLRVTSHPRTGTHLLMKLIHQNFATKCTAYHKLWDGHIPPFNKPGVKHVGVLREVAPTLVSMWHLRGRFGCNEKVSFAEFIRTPWYEIPGTSLTKAVFNGRTHTATTKTFKRAFWMTPPQTWLYIQKHILHSSLCCIDYSDMVSQPEECLDRIAKAAKQTRHTPFKPVKQTVGWTPVTKALLVVTDEDKALLREVQLRFDEFRSLPMPATIYTAKHYKWVRAWRDGFNPHRRRKKFVGVRKRKFRKE